MDTTVLETAPTTTAATILVLATDNNLEYRDVILQPGTRAKDVLNSLNLQGHWGLRRPDDSGTFLGPNEEVIPVLREAGTDKLEAVPNIVVA
jgi:hypothetical protein